MGKPVRHQQGIELTCVPVVEADDEFASVGTEALQRMRVTRRKIPKVSLLHVRDVRAALCIGQ